DTRRAARHHHRLLERVPTRSQTPEGIVRPQENESEILMARISKKHLAFSEWPAEDRSRWNSAFEPGDDFDQRPGDRLSKPTIIGLRTAYARFLGFLASQDPQKLSLSPGDRPEQESIKLFVEHLRESCRDTSIASLLHKLRLALRLICPGTD